VTAHPARQRWLVPIVVVVVSATVGGGLLARELYRRPQPEPSEPIAVATSTPALAPSEEPGSDTVEVTADVATHPKVDDVRTVLQGYFAAINNKNYQQWEGVVTAARRNDQPYEHWIKGVKSTTDGSILLYRIEQGTAPQSLRVLVGFTSTQKVEDAPSFFRKPCIRWRLVLPMVIENKSLRIDSGIDNGLYPEHEEC
jgi:hypothetical protein